MQKTLLASMLLDVVTCTVNANEQLRSKGYEGKSEAELACELANPNTLLTSLKFKSQYRSFIGDLPDGGWSIASAPIVTHDYETDVTT